MTCPVHTVVNTICYWGPRPVKNWKRPAAAAISVAIFAASIALWWVFGERGLAATWPILIAVAIGGFGSIVSVFGCYEFVARSMGEF